MTNPISARRWVRAALLMLAVSHIFAASYGSYASGDEHRRNGSLQLEKVVFVNSTKDGTELSPPNDVFSVSQVLFVGWRITFTNRLHGVNSSTYRLAATYIAPDGRILGSVADKQYVSLNQKTATFTGRIGNSAGHAFLPGQYTVHFYLNGKYFTQQNFWVAAESVPQGGQRRADENNGYPGSTAKNEGGTNQFDLACVVTWATKDETWPFKGPDDMWGGDKQYGPVQRGWGTITISVDLTLKRFIERGTEIYPHPYDRYFSPRPHTIPDSAGSNCLDLHAEFGRDLGGTTFECAGWGTCGGGDKTWTEHVCPDGRYKADYYVQVRVPTAKYWHEIEINGICKKAKFTAF